MKKESEKMLVIYESYPWKKDLKRQKNLLIKYNTPLHFEKNYDVTYTAIEKAIFYSAFIIRKLIDCGVKLSDEADNYTISAYYINPLKPVDQYNRWPEEDSHDWDNEKRISISGKVVCNSLIHSYLFFVRFNESEFIDSFCVSSDFDRNKLLYRVPLDEWLKYVDYITTDDVVKIDFDYDDRQGEYICTCKVRGKRNRSIT